MLKCFFQKFINKHLSQIRTIDGSIYLDLLVADVSDEYVYGYCQGLDFWVCIPFFSIASILSSLTLQEMEEMEGQ